MDRRPATMVVALLSAGLLLLTIPLTFDASAASTDGHPPTVPHLVVIRGTGGCEIDLHIRLSTDTVDAQAAIRYQVRANGSLPPGNTLHAFDVGHGNGILYPAYGLPQGGGQSFTVVAVDTAGNHSAPSNAVTHTFGGPCR